MYDRPALHNKHNTVVASLLSTKCAGFLNKKIQKFAGPPCVPLLGSIPFLRSKNFHFQMEEMREKYGPVIGLKFGTKNAIAICGTKEVEEALKRDEFQGRPIFPDSSKG